MPPRSRALVVDVAARAERDDARASSRRYGSSSGSPAGTTAVGAVAHPDEQLGLRPRDALERAHLLEVHGPDVRDHADVGLADRGQLGDLAEAAHRQLEHEHLGARRRGEQLQRQPDLGVEVRAARGDRAVRGDHRRDQVLRRRLADRAGDRDHVRGQVAPPCARQRAERRERMLGGEHGAALGRRGGLARPGRRGEHAPCAGRSASAANSPPSTRSPGSATNRSPGSTARESITTRAGPVGGAVAPAHAARPRPRRRSAGRSSASRATSATPRATARSASRATVDVVERLLAPAGELLALLVALAGDHDDVAGLGQLDRAGDRGAAVGLALDVDAAAGTPPKISSMIASGGSERGLSEVTIATSASRAAISPISGRFAAVAVAAGAEHDDHAAVGQLARRREHVLERAGLVRVVDEHRERAAPRRPPGSAPARGATSRSASRHLRPASSPSASPPASATSALAALKRPAQRQLDRRLAGRRADA